MYIFTVGIELSLKLTYSQTLNSVSSLCAYGNTFTLTLLMNFSPSASSSALQCSGSARRRRSAELLRRKAELGKCPDIRHL